MRLIHGEKFSGILVPLAKSSLDAIQLRTLVDLLALYGAEALTTHRRWAPPLL